MSDTDPCPCGSGVVYAGCCGPIIDGTPAPTAEALMRSRYSAYVKGAIDHVVATHDAATRGEVDRDGAAQWSRETEWGGLEILATAKGREGDTEGTVEFVARGATRGQPFAQRERARFKKVDGSWYYVDGDMVREPVRAKVTPGRNEPCPCGSGKKYKKCHGA